MTTIHAPGFTAAEFAKLRAITAKLHGEWFPAWKGVHNADLPAAARLSSDLEQLVSIVANRQLGPQAA